MGGIDPTEIRTRASERCAEIAIEMLGEPNWKLSHRGRELRWGTRGSLLVNLRTGKWHDWETGEHGDMADLVIRELGGNQRTAFQWLCRWLGVEAGDIVRSSNERCREREEKRAKEA